MELAIHAGLTGHSVLTTLHTNSAMGAVPRLFDMHVEPFLLGSTLNAIIAQRLVRKICLKCKEEVTLPDDLIKSVMEKFDAIANLVIKNLVLIIEQNQHRYGFHTWMVLPIGH